MGKPLSFFCSVNGCQYFHSPICAEKPQIRMHLIRDHDYKQLQRAAYQQQLIPSLMYRSRGFFINLLCDYGITGGRKNWEAYRIYLKEIFKISAPVFIVGLSMAINVNNVKKNTVLLIPQTIYASKIRRYGINCICKLHAMNISIIDAKRQKVVNVGVINKKKIRNDFSSSD